MPDRIRALYVDDEPGLLEVARLFLEQSPEFSVETAQSAKLALSSPSIASYDAIVSDYQMPDMDGIAFLKAVRAKYGEIPFILFTGRGREEVVIQAINNGADFYLQKGGDPTAQFAELAHKIRQAVSRKKAQEELKAAYEQITASEEELRGQYEELAAGERRVRESQELLRTFLDSATDAFTIWDADLNLVDMNQVALSYLPPGAKKEDIIGKNLQEFFSGEKEWRSVDRYREVLRTGVPFTSTGKQTGLPHDNRWLNVKCFRVGNGLGIMTTDVTREKEAEEKLRAAYEKLSASEEELREQYEEIAFAQARLIESREQMTEIAETVPGVVFQSLFHPAKSEEFTFLSHRVPDVFGISAEREGFTERFLACVDPRDRELMARSIREAVANGAPWEFEGRFTKPSGEAIWFQGLARPVRKATGLYYNGVLLDITSRKRAEEAVIDQAAKLHEAQEMAHLGFWNWDICTGNVEWSDEVFRIFGLDPATFCPSIDSILARSPWPEEQNRAREIVRKATESHEPGSYEQRFLRPDNSTGYYYSTYQGRYDDQGNLTSLIGTVLDITSRKTTEMELRESEDRYRSIIDHAPYGMHFYKLDPARGLVFTGANPAADRILGISHDPFIGKTIEEAFPGLTGTEIPRAYRNVAETGATWETEQVNYNKESISGAYSVVAFRTAPGFMAAMFVDITGRKKAEEALREKTEELDQYFTASLDLFCIADIEGRFRRLNPEWERTLGYTLAELEGHRFLDFVHPDDLAATLAAVGDLNRQKTVLNFTNRYRHKDGSYRWIEWRSFPKGDLIFAAARDITERKATEEALRESEDKYRSLVDVSPVAVAVHRKGKIVFANPEAVRLLKAGSAEELVGKDVLPFIHPDYHAKASEDFRIMAEEGRMIPLQEEVLLKVTGEPFTVEVVAKPIRYEGLPSVLVAFRDITERKTMEVALRESEEKYRTIIEHATEAVVIIQDSRIVYANPRMAELSGFTEADLVGTPFLELVWPDDRPLLKERHQRRVAGEDVPSRYDFRFIGPQEKARWISLSVALIPWQGRLATINLMTDITERKLSEAALREAGRKLALLNSVTRHDIRNQLITLQGFAQYLIKKEQDPDLARYLAKIDTSAKTIRQQIEFMKTYQELGANSAAWFRLDETVGKAAIKEIPCSASCSGFLVFSDPMLEKAFSNLFDNALRHGKHVTAISVQCGETGDGQLLVVVKDDGVGIPDDEKEKIFEKGYGKNTGFGLFLVREILSITGITIRENGTPGKGALFEIQVPKECWRRANE